MEDQKAQMDEARSFAIADANRIAEQPASELGMELGEATYINEWVDYYPVSGISTLCADFAGNMSAPSISPGTHSISLSVQITFQMN